MALGRVAVEIEAKVVSFNYKTNKRANWPAEIAKNIIEIEKAVGNDVHVHTASHKEHAKKPHELTL